jgi:cyclophilin family peptidyl-prolyl cis-trans isomerase
MSVKNFKGYVKSGFYKGPSFTVSFQDLWFKVGNDAGKEDNTSTY